MSARYIKSLEEPERGYRHREHRSAKGRDPYYQTKRITRLRKTHKREEWEHYNKQSIKQIAKVFNSKRMKKHL